MNSVPSVVIRHHSMTRTRRRFWRRLARVRLAHRVVAVMPRAPHQHPEEEDRECQDDEDQLLLGDEMHEHRGDEPPP